MNVQIDEKVDILVVDDREDGLIAIEAILAEEPNYNLIKARSGIEAIRLLPKHDFAVVLMDVQMPDLDGFQTAEIIQRQPRFQTLPVIFVTAINKDERYIYRGYAAGAVDYIFKPLDPMIIRSKVEVFARLHIKERQVREQNRQLAEQENFRHQAEMQLLEIENLKRYRNLADAIPHMVWRTSATGQMEYSNELWRKYTGLPPRDTAGMGWQEAFHPSDIKVLLENWTMANRDCTPFEMEARVRRYDGVYRWHWLKAVCEKGENGEVIAWLGSCTDINDRKSYETQLVEAQAAAESANRAKTQFLANVSHEIRTPLNAIIGFTELMLDPDIPADEKFDNLSIVRRNGQQLLKIINEVLDISKVEAGGLEIERLETHLPNLISSIKSMMSVIAFKKNLKLDIKVIGEIPDRIWTDSTRLQQILTNIVGNALKFTIQGGVLLTVEQVGGGAGDSARMRFVVHDTGVGIDKSAAEKIFLPFTQADSSTTRVYGGTGLGLALSRRLARALGGDLWLQASEPGQGSTFVMEIEAQVAPEARWVRRFTDLEDGDEIGTGALKSVQLQGRRILLVEDAEDNQILISCFLQNSGAKIDIARNGKEAVEKALANDYSLVLMDIQMPLLDGYEATSRLRQAGFRRPIIALTAHALNEERDKCLRVGCNAHLTKPINRRQLIDSVVRYLN
jgi:two-component system, sensor histidine kinase